MFFYIYFMQGIIFSISSTMPYIYPKLPSYSQMSLFFASLFPWSLKFLIGTFSPIQPLSSKNTRS